MVLEEISDRITNKSPLYLNGLTSQKKFIQKKHLQEEKEGHNFPKPIAEIISLDQLEKNFKNLLQLLSLVQELNKYLYSQPSLMMSKPNSDKNA